MPRVDSALDLLDLTADEADAFFATEDAELVVGLVDVLSDRELARLVDVPHLRTSAVRHVLGRLEEFALPAPLAEVEGAVEFRVDVPKGDPEVHVLVFDGSGVAVAPAGTRPPDVTISLAALDFVRMVSGGRNAALLLLGDRLRVDGDEQLALRVGGVFRVPGRPGVAVDPSAVDPEQAALVLAGVKDRHLERLMSGGFREVVLDQVLTRLPEFLDEKRAADATLAVAFRIDGRPDGGSDRVTVYVDRGSCRAERDADGHRDATLVLGGAQFLKLVTGHLNPVTGVVRGALKVKGDLNAALTLYRIMRIPGRG
jgi:putative sterol carrier protein